MSRGDRCFCSAMILLDKNKNEIRSSIITLLNINSKNELRYKNQKRIMVRDGMSVVSVDALKNCYSHFKLIPCCFWFIFSAYAKFHRNRTKNTEVKNFQCWLVLVGRAGRWKNGCRYFKLTLCCFCSIISHHSKFHPNRTKKTEVRNFQLVDFGWSGW